ncbi:MAG: amino acid permease [Proteobacteria bacterium]|nr:amino acid permease [Pseudomonadota bacterium]
MSGARLNRVLGLGFALAFAFGTMVGVGILRLPGMVAAAAGTPALILACWAAGGLYALLGAFSLSELAVMYPEAGGMRVYARRAFGEPVGFVVGWVDWLASVATLAYAAVAGVDFLGVLWPAVAAPPVSTLAAVALLGLFMALHWGGVRSGSVITTAASTLIGLLLLVLIAACFLHGGAVRARLPPGTAAAVPAASWLAIVPALRAIVTAYDGWYAPIYTAEECREAARTLPRAIIGGALLVTLLYLAINAALLQVLPVPVLAASTLPVAVAAQLVLPQGAAALLTGLSILIVLGLINANALMAPRVLFGMARDGWIPQGLARVSARGTPRAALAATIVLSSLMILTGTFNQLIALFAVLILLYYVVVFLAVFALRRRAPQVPRPYRALGYPVSTLIVTAGSLALLFAAVREDPRSGLMALGFILLCVPLYALAARARRPVTA